MGVQSAFGGTEANKEPERVVRKGGILDYT
jgi:hypothetical protein